jgi:predicted DCC family thiol-disulfide oxidoreductase YuxK
LHIHNFSDHRIVFYDGECALCNRTVTFLIKADRNQKLKFAPLDGVTAKHLNINDASEGEASVVFYNNGIVYYRSTAILNIINQLPFPWKLFYVFKIVPTFIRDFCYRTIGRNRYNWFGKAKSCIINESKYKGRLLD